MRTLTLSIILISGFLPGCGEQTTTSTTTATPSRSVTATPAAGAVHATAAVAPGSYEDWCGEHGVPETQCTRCDASLIPAFKATKDWCAEHNVPESQCLKCNPTLKIVRPAKAGAK